MKSESIKIFAELMLSADVPEFAKDKLAQVMRIEEKIAKVRGFAMSDYVDKKSKGLRPALEGIFYDESGYEVATDGHILIYRKAEIPEHLKNQVLMPNGEILAKDRYTRYPNWRAVVPDAAKFATYNIDFDKVEQLATDWKSKKKLDSYKKVVPFLYINETIYVNLELFVKLVKAMRFAGINEIKYDAENPTRPLVFGSLESFGGLLMPLLPPQEKSYEELLVYTL